MSAMLILSMCLIAMGNNKNTDNIPYGKILYSLPQASRTSELQLLNLNNYPQQNDESLYSGQNMSIRSPSYSPQLNLVLAQLISTSKTGNQYSLGIIDLTSRNIVKTIELEGHIYHHPAWSPDGRKFAFLVTPYGGGYNEKWQYRGQNYLYIYDMESRKAKRVTSINMIPNKPYWTLDMNHIIVCREDGIICKVNVDDGSIREICEGIVPSLSHNGKMLAFKRNCSSLNAIINEFLFGKTMAEAFSRDYKIMIRELDTGREIIIEKNPPKTSLANDGLVWSPEDDWIFYYGQISGIKNLLRKSIGYGYIRHIGNELIVGDRLKVYGPNLHICGADWIK